MTRSVIDPITRIEGHLRVEMEVDSARQGFRRLGVRRLLPRHGARRGEPHARGCRPDRAAHLRRVPGIARPCLLYRWPRRPTASPISNKARIIRNLHRGRPVPALANILWLYNLAALDYVNPLNALEADIRRRLRAGASGRHVYEHRLLQPLAEAHQVRRQRPAVHLLRQLVRRRRGHRLSRMTPEADLICTAHYLEALKMQAKRLRDFGAAGRQDAARHDPHPRRHGLRAHRAEA